MRVKLAGGKLRSEAGNRYSYRKAKAVPVSRDGQIGVTHRHLPEGKNVNLARLTPIALPIHSDRLTVRTLKIK